jgi:hypothetical protein
MAPSTAGRVVSVFCAGTDYDASSDDVIARLYAAASGEASVQKFFYAGPGSMGAAKRHPKVDAVDELVKGVVRDATGLPAHKLGTNVGRIIDTASGMSMHLNVEAAGIEIWPACANGSATVNLAGWSRGAVTCIGIANALAKRGVSKINLFLFDPVPGTKAVNLWNWTQELNTLPDAVRRASVVLMEQMVGGVTTAKELLLQPLTAPFAGGTATVYPMPGRHNSAVENDSVFPEVAAIGEHLCTEFLLANGTGFERTRLLRESEIVEQYAAIKKRHKTASASAGYTDRSFTVDNPLRESLFFVNQHHRQTFAAVYPGVAQILDAGFEVPRWSARVADEARRLRGGSPAMAGIVAAGLGALIAARNGPSQRSRHDAEDLVRLCGALNGWTAEQLQAALGVVATPLPPVLAAVPLLTPVRREPTIGAAPARSTW